MTVVVLFSLRVAADVTLGEGDLPGAFRTIADKVGPDRLPGKILLLAAGQPVAFVEDDDLEFTVSQPLAGIPELAAGRPAAIGFSEAPGAVHLTPDDGTLRVTSDYARPMTAPVAEVLPALLGCCERFVAFVRTAYADRSDVLQRIEMMEPVLREARTAVGRG